VPPSGQRFCAIQHRNENVSPQNSAWIIAVLYKCWWVDQFVSTALIDHSYQRQIGRYMGLRLLGLGASDGRKLALESPMIVAI
jgi:hypothetical protein